MRDRKTIEAEQTLTGDKLVEVILDIRDLAIKAFGVDVGSQMDQVIEDVVTAEDNLRPSELIAENERLRKQVSEFEIALTCHRKEIGILASDNRILLESLNRKRTIIAGLKESLKKAIGQKNQLWTLLDDFQKRVNSNLMLTLSVFVDDKEEDADPVPESHARGEVGAPDGSSPGQEPRGHRVTS